MKYEFSYYLKGMLMDNICISDDGIKVYQKKPAGTPDIDTFIRYGEICEAQYFWGTLQILYRDRTRKDITVNIDKNDKHSAMEASNWICQKAKEAEAKGEIIIKEYRKRCNVCGKVFCYTGDDILRSERLAKVASTARTQAVLGALAGPAYNAQLHSSRADSLENQIVDYNKCPSCNSSNLTLLEDDVTFTENTPRDAKDAQLALPANEHVDVIEQLSKLHEQGILTDEEYQQKKSSYLGDVQTTKPAVENNPQIEKQWECIKCNAVNKEKANFCSQCGEMRHSDWTCAKCNESNSASARFCCNCGQSKEDTERMRIEEEERRIREEEERKRLEEERRIREEEEERKHLEEEERRIREEEEKHRVEEQRILEQGLLTERMLFQIHEKSNATEIYNYVLAVAEDSVGVRNKYLCELLESLKKTSNVEKVYGNNKIKAIAEIESYHQNLMKICSTASTTEQKAEKACKNPISPEEECKIREEDCKRLEEERKSLEDERKCLEEERKSLEDEHKRLEEERKSLEDERKCLEEEHKCLEEERKRLEDEHKRLEEERKRLEEERKRLEEEEHKRLEEERRIREEEESNRLEEERQKEEAEALNELKNQEFDYPHPLKYYDGVCPKCGLKHYNNRPNCVRCGSRFKQED